MLETFLEFLNSTRFNATPPDGLKDLYNTSEYVTSQNYKKDKLRLSIIQSSSFVFILLLFLQLDGFRFVDAMANSLVESSVLVSLIFFGILFFASELLSLPYEYYATFVIEEKYGFNTSTRALFWVDKLKSLALGIFLGGLVLGVILLFYKSIGLDFWWYAWILITCISFLLNMFYAKLFVPLFNVQTPLASGRLRNEIEHYAAKMNFSLQHMYVIDGSKRSQKSNAYFSGFGKEKRITLYDTLLKDLDAEEVVAVLAHEVGHYKKNHIIISFLISTLSVGFTLWLLSLWVSEPLLAQALGVKEPSFHIGLVAFSFIYTPLSMVLGLISNSISRKFEYQADDFAKQTYSGFHLSSALKKLSKKSLSNLTPHPAYVYFHFSHPPLLKRLQNLENNL